MTPNNNVLKFPFVDTPFWTYMDTFYRRSKRSDVLATMYLQQVVPQQLRQQVVMTLDELMKDVNNDTQ